jgi:hypothetical protein
MAGQLSLRAIAYDYGVTEGALRKRIKARGLVRSLKPKIAVRAEQRLVDAVGQGMAKAERHALRQQIRDAVAPGEPAAHLTAVLKGIEDQQVEVVATAIAAIIGQQRKQAHTAQKLVTQLIGDLTAAAQHRGRLGQ